MGAEEATFPGTYALVAQIERKRTPIQLADLAGHIERLEPVRKPHVSRKSKHMPGRWFSSSTGEHVQYESLLERSSLLQIDFEGQATHIVAQPFRLVYRVNRRAKTHVPDFLLKSTDGSLTLVDVKRAADTLKPDVMHQFGYCSEFCAQAGLFYRVMTEADPQYLANLRWLAGYRQEYLIDSPEFERIWALLAQGPKSIGDLLRDAEVPCLARPALFGGMWSGHFTADLLHPLTSETQTRRSDVGQAHGNDGNGLAG